MTRAIMRMVLAIFFVLAGIGHLLLTDGVVRIVPSVVPFPRTVVIVTGICEIAGAGLLLTARFRRIAGILLALYSVCVFPANIKHAVEGIPLLPFAESWWYHAPRLAFQPVIVWWALFCSGVIDWPTRRSNDDSRRSAITPPTHPSAR